MVLLEEDGLAYQLGWICSKMVAMRWMVQQLVLLHVDGGLIDEHVVDVLRWRSTGGCAAARGGSAT